MAVETQPPGADLAVPRAVSPVTESTRSRPVLIWAAIGAIMLAFELYVLVRWLTGPNLVHTRPGVDPVSGTAKALYLALEVAVTLATVVCMYVWVVRPRRREGRLTTDGMLALSGGMLFFWDMGMNYTSVSLLYNSNFVNLGAWASGSWPGWTSPNANLLPEPLLICIPGYTCLCFAQVVLILFVLRRVKARWPGLGSLATVGVIVVGLTVIDTVIETLLLRTGIYAYPSAIRSITLFAGHTYQVPMSETILFGGCGLGAVACLSHFRDDRGRTVVERGLDRVRAGARGRQWVKFLAIFGAVHLAFLAFYFVPQQWFATHGDSWPAGYETYMINGMCRYPGGAGAVQARGVRGVPCPGPGVAIPRS
jgi:hypothetical protein